MGAEEIHSKDISYRHLKCAARFCAKEISVQIQSSDSSRCNKDNNRGKPIAVILQSSVSVHIYALAIQSINRPVSPLVIISFSACSN